MKDRSVVASKEQDDLTIDKWLAQSANAPIEIVAISKILPGPSPRTDTAGRIEHVRLLAEAGSSLPPIVVHRSSMKLIDGSHRLAAAGMRGESEIAVRYFDGSESDAFVLAVRLNVEHGLPLSLADRKAAAARLVTSNPDWSDRLVASITGLSHKTVGSQRRRVSGENTQLHGRIGKDGKVRPTEVAEGRQRAAQIIRSNPTASLREVAKIAGISTGTVRDVRRRLENSAELNIADSQGAAKPSESGRMTSGQTSAPARPTLVSVRQRNTETTASIQEMILQNLRNDPALRFTDHGRSVLRRLATTVMDIKEWEHLLAGAPEHCKGALAKLAHANADSWTSLARSLEQTSSEIDLGGEAERRRHS
ncbi:putative regulatory protein [Nocardia nova SH22a]|uniref:Putative regulatory protein n=1 Tax=Nocardia nova SH22a TaxID=1415166 RepID=W5TG07_9NOCA|nr:ParB/RepB/Spo0J family partition protein [Nocardia nova]AHH18290.1 putative regulatory protein [Nocardia nova SH22a]